MFSSHNGIRNKRNIYIWETPNIWKLNNILLNNSQVKEIKIIRMYFELNKVCENLRDAIKRVLKWKYKAIYFYIRKSIKSITSASMLDKQKKSKLNTKQQGKKEWTSIKQKIKNKEKTQNQMLIFGLFILNK